MKKIYVLAVLAILVIGVFIAAGMAADVVQQPLSTGHTSASQLSAQAFKHREWVWVPGMATEVNWEASSPLLDYATVRKNYCMLGLKGGAVDVEVSVPVELRGNRRLVRNIMLCTEGGSSSIRVDKIDLYDGNLYRGRVFSTGAMSFEGYQENTFDLGSYASIDRGLTVVIYIDNLAAATTFTIHSVGAQTRW